MLKCLVTLAALIAFSVHSLPSSDNDRIAQKTPKIASGFGFPGGRTANDFAFLSIVFPQRVEICGGSLISKSWILTSASCVFNATEVKIAFGGSNYPSFNQSNIFVHPEYNNVSHANDIALVKITRPAWTDGVRYGFAILDRDTRLDAFIDKTALFCGWGIVDNQQTFSRSLICTNLNIVPGSTCSNNSNIICTKSMNTDNNACIGDFGGPLYVSSGRDMVVVGIATFAPDVRSNAVCLDGHVVEFSHVARFKDFITKTIVENL